MNLKRIYSDSIDIIASSLHYQDHCTGFNHGIINPMVDRGRVTYAQIEYMKKGSRERYMNDPIFHARVESIVSCLFHAIENGMDREIHEQVARIINEG